MRRRKWTDKENDFMLKLVNEYGAENWEFIASKMHERTGKQCRDHYINVLDPNIKKEYWTSEEDTIILVKYKELGTRWSSIVEFLPGRTQSMIKNRCKYLLSNCQMNKDQKVHNPPLDDKSQDPEPEQLNETEISPLDLSNLLNSNSTK